MPWGRWLEGKSHGDEKATNGCIADDGDGLRGAGAGWELDRQFRERLRERNYRHGAGKSRGTSEFGCGRGRATRNFALATPEASSANASAPAADPGAAPAAKPKYVFGERDDYRWQLALGVEFFRFQSNLINASMVGLNTTVTYFTNDWFALEGNLVTGFAPADLRSRARKIFWRRRGNSGWNTQGEI